MLLFEINEGRTSQPNPFTYTARETAEAGLMYYRARYYQPEIGRFVSEDPVSLTGPVEYDHEKSITIEKAIRHNFKITAAEMESLTGSHSLLIIGALMHEYNYALQNPIIFTDPSDNVPVCRPNSFCGITCNLVPPWPLPPRGWFDGIRICVVGTMSACVNGTMKVAVFFALFSFPKTILWVDVRDTKKPCCCP